MRDVSGGMLSDCHCRMDDHLIVMEGEVGGKAGALGLAACGRGVGLFVEGELRDAERRGVVLGVGVERRGHTVGQTSARYRRRGGG